MSPENFIYWLNGFVEMGGERPTDEQWLIIKEHLVLAMSKKTMLSISQNQPPLYFDPAKPMELVC
jgi:hypothetical protein